MNPSLVFLVLLVAMGVAAREKQIKLEDIERDNLQSERKTKEVKQYLSRPQATPTPKMQYGFVPIKAPVNYIPQAYQEQPQQQYYLAPQAYTQPQTFPGPPAQPQPYGQTRTPYQYQPQYSEGYRPQTRYEQVQYVQPGVQYVVDNQIQQTTQAQKYYQVPQYYYVQPYQAASNNIQSVTDSKGNVQYVMYVPASYLKDQNYASLTQPQQYATQPEQYATQPEQYATQPQQYATQPEQPQPQQEVQYQSEQKYQYQPEPQIQTQPKYTQIQYTEKPKYSKHPKSLLDSYVPSVLQYQFYKQHQDNTNSIKQIPKISVQPNLGKSEYVKSFKTIQDAGSHLNYRLHSPAAYIPQSVKQ
ncbi:PREDICTED: protein transport protein SEC24-like [Nicrophorus vespilloides]|uniref:Protein transport protein SEC24-like n=1 Tax=Nicrophorus vespilloides TaxID=110193 RepID=A0ABM1MGQ0_NICVS|nr:PREDICTED: protein transport protein SEC24-like [Nicrophorus vespilloides]